MFVICYSVCPWQASPAQSNVRVPRAYPKEERRLGAPVGFAPNLPTNN
jgi:hypothetical protein